ncbi:MAG: efflux RND transporter periplasmic adaptor subunit [Candidatus Omnitrophota bacterium]|nr:efflux RND transporter periplasmic adaptor subunit [Candidatus Omnitrophota bacterium]MDD5655249.1 efflux RND transporter periplasmic adaptor subunit [Candidatus Omnitrophota bacterium]
MIRSGKALKKIVWLIMTAVIVFLIVKGIAGRKPKEQALPSRPAQVAYAAQNDMPIFIDSFGSLAPTSDVDIKSQVTGQIKEVRFNEGQEVRKGDPLFIIDPSPFQAELDKAQAALAQDIADLNLKKDTLERNKSLFTAQLISQQDFDKYEADFLSAEQKIKLDQANIDLAKINLGYCNIISPVDGLTGKRQVDPGNIVTANTGPTLVNIKTLDPLYVDFTVPESELARVRVSKEEGQLEVKVSLQEDPATFYSGTLQLLSNTVDNTTGTIALRAFVDNKEKKLWPGQFVQVRLILGILRDAVIVPYDAVELGQNGYFLFVVTKENKADLRLVTIGPQIDDNVVILTGVSSGEKVVTSGQMGLSPGADVMVIKSDNPK